MLSVEGFLPANEESATALSSAREQVARGSRGAQGLLVLSECLMLEARFTS